ncbi:hypothetical protein [Rhizobium sp. G21]|uniref:hypothetical protein n=1 Tax=Rhizobium sp. G21 TaxID=2758439 RepID=UPI0016035E45|nr:hypothetical protein [Rhizobium sp. G21]MBB1247465.1 hypothetical protein [Rhizobium sp. G21]
MAMNIRNEEDRAALIAKGFQWATVSPRGDSIGTVLSKHKSYEAAERAAKGLERRVVNIADAQ